jgi:peptidyl-prolyl cis-trans isomerase D
MSIMWIKSQAKWVIVGAGVLVAAGLILMDRQGAYRSGFHGDYVGSVDGEELQTGAFQQDMKNYIQSEEARTGKAPESQQLARMRENLFLMKVQSILLQKLFKAYEMYPSVPEMQDYLLGHPQEVAGSLARFEGPDNVPLFLHDSTFDPARYEGWLRQDSVYDRIGMRALESQLRGVIVPQLQFQQLLRSQAHRTDLEESFSLAMREDLGKIRFYRAPLDSFPVSPSKFGEPELRAYFKAHPDSFSYRQEAARLDYVRIPIRPSAEDTALMREFAAELKTRAQSGEDFGELAKSYSNDPGSADSGGRLGGFQPRSAWVPQFADAAYRLEPGQISDPVLTPFGYHVIRMNAKKTEDGVEKAELSHILLKITAGTSTTDSLTDLAEKVKSEAEQKGLEAAAAAQGLTVEKTPVFEKGSPVPLQAYLAGVQSFAFSPHEKKAKISDVLQNDEGIYVFGRDVQFDRGRDFERARDAIAIDLAREEQLDLARKDLEASRARIAASETLPATVDKAVLDSTGLIPVESYVPAFGYGSPELLRCFRQKQGEWGPVRTAPGAVVIAERVQYQPLDPELKQRRAREAVAQGDMQLVSGIFQQWLGDLPRSVKVENNLDLVYRN